MTRMVEDHPPKVDLYFRRSEAQSGETGRRREDPDMERPPTTGEVGGRSIRGGQDSGSVLIETTSPCGMCVGSQESQHT